MGRGCTRITKPPYTPLRVLVSSWISWLDRELPIISGWVPLINVSIFNSCHFHHPYFASLFGTVHWPFSPRELVHTWSVHPNPWHHMLCHHKPHYILPQNNHPTYLSRHLHSLSEIHCHATSTLSWLDIHVIHVFALSMTRMKVGSFPKNCYMTR